MKVKTYLRVARGHGKQARVVANARPNPSPLSDHMGVDLPTVAFAVVFEIPDEAFRAAERVLAEIEVPIESISLSAAVEAEAPR